MWYDENIASYGDINYKINKIYCDKYNIELIKCNERRHSNRHPAWERIPLILKYINDYDYVMWIDADAFFYNDANNIVDIINDNRNYNFIFSNDVGNNNINTGVYIVKNSQYSIDFLTRWQSDEDLYNNNPVPGWWDQGVLIEMFNQNILDIKNNCIIFDYGILQHFYEGEIFPKKSFIHHLAGRNSECRINNSLNYIKQNNILLDLN
jgi:hypothetical protein